MIQKPKGTTDLYGTDAEIYKYIENYTDTFSFKIKI